VILANCEVVRADRSVGPARLPAGELFSIRPQSGNYVLGNRTTLGQCPRPWDRHRHQ
jgi:hypothetical protein